MYNGQTPSRNKSEYWNGNIKWLSSGELNRGTVYDSMEMITEDGQKSANLRIVPKGTFIMAITGLEAAGTRGNCALLGFDTTLNQSCMALFPKKDLLTSDFLFQWYRKVGEEYGINYTQGTKQQSYNAELIKILPISLPSVAEQRKIASYLSNLDHLITLHQRKCDEVKSLKKYMLQKMFPQNEQKVPEIRFEEFTEACEQRKFSDIAARESFVSTSASDIPSVEYEDVVAEEGRLNKDIRLKEAVKSGITFDGSQVLYGKLRPYLHNWLNPDFKGIAVGDWWVLKPINMDKNFLYRLIQTQQFDNIANQSSGSKMPRADWNLISNSEFMVPFSKEEQSKIGRYFDSLDNLITLHQRKPISHLNHPTIHTKHKGEEKYVRIRVNDREKTNRTANLRRFPVDIPRRFKDGGGSVGEFQIYSGAE